LFLNDATELAQICELSRVMKFSEDSLCTIDRTFDTTDLKRQYQCSTLTPCYNSDTSVYDDTLCPLPYESCGKIFEQTKTIEGCTHQ